MDEIRAFGTSAVLTSDLKQFSRKYGSFSFNDFVTLDKLWGDTQ